MLDRRIKFRHIQCFVEIARERSLKLAAEKLFLTQPAISKTLKELEEIAGASLMSRSRSGVALTREGEVFLHFAQMSLASIQQGLEGVEREAQAEKVRLVIGALPSVAARILPEVVEEFTALAPHAVLEIIPGPHGYMVDQLKSGSMDMVIGRLGQPGTMQGISFTQIYTETVVFVVRPGHPMLARADIRDLADYQVIYPPPGSAILPLVEDFLIANGAGLPPNRLETVSGAFARIYVPKTDAVWVISDGVVGRELEAGRLVKLPFDTRTTRGPVGLMTRPDMEKAPVHQLFQLAVRNVLERMNTT